MKIHKLALLISVVILPTQELLARSIRDLAQPVASKPTMAAPTQTVGKPTIVVPARVTNKASTISSRPGLKVPQNRPFTEKSINLANNKQLYLTNGKSIVRVGIRGLKVIEKNGSVKLTYSNASLFERLNKEVWISGNGRKTKIGVFARIKPLNTLVKSIMTIGTVVQTRKAINSGKGAHPIVVHRPINLGSIVQVTKQVAGSGQGNTPPGTSYGLGDELGLAATDLVADPGPASLAPVSLSVTTDSVVATAVVTINSKQTKFKLHWGDDQVENINLLTPSSVSLGGGNDKVKNINGGVQYTFQHVYQAPGGRRIIIVVSTDAEGKQSNTTKAAEIEARYKLSFYRISLRFPDHLDAFFEHYSEMRVDLDVLEGRNLLFHKKWAKSVLTNPTTNQSGAQAQWRLDGSNFSREVSVGDEPITIQLVLREQDGLGEDGSLLNDAWDVVSSPFRALQYIKEKVDVEFEPYVTDPPIHIHPNDSSAIGDKSRSYRRISAHEIGNEEGSVYSTFSYDFKLIVPIDSVTPVSAMY